MGSRERALTAVKHHDRQKRQRRSVIGKAGKKRFADERTGHLELSFLHFAGILAILLDIGGSFPLPVAPLVSRGLLFANDDGSEGVDGHGLCGRRPVRNAPQAPSTRRELVPLGSN